MTKCSTNNTSSFLPSSIGPKACWTLYLWCNSHPISTRDISYYLQVLDNHMVGKSVVVCVEYKCAFVTNISQVSHMRLYFLYFFLLYETPLTVSHDHSTSTLIIIESETIFLCWPTHKYNCIIYWKALL